MSELDLHAEFDDAVGGNAIEGAGGLRVARHQGAEPLTPAHHRLGAIRQHGFSAQEKCGLMELYRLAFERSAGEQFGNVGFLHKAVMSDDPMETGGKLFDFNTSIG